MLAVGKTRLVDVDALTIHPMNRRTITTEMFVKLRRSIREDPELLRARPVLALPDGRIIGGRFRWEAAKAEGWSKVPTFAIDVDEDRALTIMLRDNNPYGQNDDDVVAEILWGLHERGRDLDLTGLPSGNVQSILQSVGQTPAERVVEQEIERPKRPKTKRGELVELGQHRLLCGDATNEDDVATLMGDARATLTFTSPPYADLREYRGGLDLRPETLARFVPLAGAVSDFVVVNLGLISREFEIVPYWDVYLEAARKAQMKLLAWNVWDKGEATSIAHQVKVMFPTYHEWLFVFGASPRKLNRTVPTKHAGVLGGAAQREPNGNIRRTRQRPIKRLKTLGSVVAMPPHKGKNDGDHPAVFPLRLPSSYIEAITDHDDVVFDPFGGSGTTLLAAAQLDRRAYLMELDPGYCDVIRERWKRYSSE